MSSEWHEHEEMEVFILIKGEPYYLRVKDIGKIKVEIGKPCYIPPGVPHKLASTASKCESIIILIPGSSTFPGGIADV